LGWLNRLELDTTGPGATFLSQTQDVESFFLHLQDINLHLHTIFNSKFDLKEKMEMPFDKTKGHQQKCSANGEVPFWQALGHI